MKMFFATAATLILTGCVVQTVKLDAPSIGLALADVMPTERELEGNRHRVVIFAPDQEMSALARSADIGATLVAELEQYSAPTGANILLAKRLETGATEPSSAARLEQEIQHFNTSGSSKQDELVAADFALTSALTDAKVSASFYPAQNWTDKKGQIFKVPAKCTYHAAIAGNIRIYNTQPRLALLNSIALDHTLTSTEETRASACPLPDERKHELLSQATQQAVKNIRVQVQNPFAPKAFIIEGKPDGNDLIFKLSGGSDNGLNAGAEVTIFTRQLMQNPLTGKESIEEIELTKGKISSAIGSNYAWITVENRSGASRIRLGDLARVRYSKGFLEKIGGLID